MPERGGLAFWIHQVVEYLLGVLVIMEAVHVDQPIVPVVIGGLVIAAAATADGPLAAVRLVPRAVHRIVDIVLAAAILALTVLFHAQMGEFGIAFSVIAALGLVALVLRTDYRPRPPRPSRSAAPPEAPSASKGEDVGRAAGRLVGRGIKAYRARKPPA